VEQQANNTIDITETVGTTLNVPRKLWKRLRLYAAREEVSQQSIWLDALSEYLRKRAA
jgi:hypothetical protein